MDRSSSFLFSFFFFPLKIMFSFIRNGKKKNFFKLKSRVLCYFDNADCVIMKYEWNLSKADIL